MDEEQGIYNVTQAGIAKFPYKRERRLFFELTQPLSAKQIAALEEDKGLYKEYYVCTETINSDGSIKSEVIETPALKDYFDV